MKTSNIRQALQELLEIPRQIDQIRRSYWGYLGTITRKEIVLLNALAITTGIITGYVAIGFRMLIGFFQNLLMHSQIGFHLVSPLEHNLGYLVILLPPFGLFVVAYITKYFAPETKGHGVPEVIEAVIRNEGRIRKRIVALKALTSSITIAVGGSVGREGPIVQIGSATGSSLGQLLKMNPKIIKTLVGCGAAGAVAATFNTPIAGVIFAVEIIILELKTKSFIPLVISSVFATGISRYYLGNDPAFFVPTNSFGHITELIFYVGLGILAGFIGAFTIRFLYFTEDLFDQAEIPFFFKPLIGGLIIGLMGFHFPQIFGVGYETVSSVLLQGSSIEIMLILILLKIIAMSVTLAAGGSGGIFAPSLFIGAMVGGSYGWMINYFFPGATAGYGAFALIGMAAMFSATCRAAFTSIVILFEMTLDYDIILPLMFVCVFADQIARLLCPDTMYSLKLKRKNVNISSDIEVDIMKVTPIKKIMQKTLVVAYEDMTMEEAQKKLLSYSHHVYPVVDQNERFKGLLLHDLLKQIDHKSKKDKVKNHIKPTLCVVGENETLFETLKKIEKHRDPRFIVIDKDSNKLKGIVCPTDFIRFSVHEESSN